MLDASLGVMLAMIHVRPGYWDVDRCTWVGVDPMYVVPPLRHADHPHDRAVAAGPPGAAEVPAQRPDPVLLDPEATAAT